MKNYKNSLLYKKIKIIKTKSLPLKNKENKITRKNKMGKQKDNNKLKNKNYNNKKKNRKKNKNLQHRKGKELLLLLNKAIFCNTFLKEKPGTKIKQ